MGPVRSLDKVKIWQQTMDNGTIKYAPFKGNQEDPSRKYFRGNMQDLKNNGHTILLLTTYEDFILALKSSKPSVSPNDIGKYI